MPASPGAAIPDDLAKRYGAATERYAGSTSVLYEGMDPETGRPVVVKVVRDGAIASAAERQRVLRELQKLAQVHYPSLPAILAAGESGGRVWVVRELIAGESLAERLATVGAMSVSEAARIASQVASALGELHRHGILHRDVRPGHVIIEPSGAVRLIDASIGRTYRSGDGRVSTGTPGYVAPESISGKLVSFRSDLYSLGSMLFEMLSGTPPYGPSDAPNVLTLQAENDPPALRVAVPPALSKLVASLLSREPRERPFSAQQLERQLEPLAFGASGDDPSSATVVGEAPEDDEEPSEPTMIGAAPTEPIDPLPSVIVNPHANDFDEDEPTQIGESAFPEPTNPAVRAAPAAHRPGAGSAAPSTRTPGNASQPARGTSPQPAASAKSPMQPVSKPPRPSVPPPRPASMPPPAPGGAGARQGSGGALRVPAAAASGPRSPTLVGMAPLGGSGHAGGGPVAANAAAAAPIRPAAGIAASVARMSQPGRREDSGGSLARSRPQRRDDSNDFEDALDTQVVEDSRIFGLPEVSRGSPHGTAVPPLPDAVAAQVLTGSLRPPNPDPRNTSSQPVIQRAGPAAAMPSYVPTIAPNNPFAAIKSPSPFVPMNSAPAPMTPNAPPQQQWPGNQGPFGTGGPPGPNHAFQSHPGGPMGPPPGRPEPSTAPGRNLPPPGYIAGQYGPYGPPPNQYPPGFGPPGGTVPYGPAPHGPPRSMQPPGTPAASASAIQTLWPWLLAGVGIAALAGAGGYSFAMRDRASRQPSAISTAAPIAEAVQQPQTLPAPVAPAPQPLVPAFVPPTPIAPRAVPPPIVRPPVVIAPPAPHPVAPAPQPAANSARVTAQPQPEPDRRQHGRAAEPEPAPRATAQRAAPAPTPAPAPARAAATPAPAAAPAGNSLAQARQLISRGDYNGAGDMLGVLARQQPNSAEVRFLHGDVLFRAHDMFGASGEIRAAVRLAPRNTEYLNRLADVQVGLGDRNAAVAALRQILVIRPNDAAAQRRIDQLTGTHTAPAQPAPAAQPRAAQPANNTNRRSNDNGGVQMFGAPARTNGGTTRSGTAGSIRR